MTSRKIVRMRSCPLNINTGILNTFDTVLPAAGSSSSCVVLTLDELEKASKAAGWIDVCKLPEIG